MALYKSLPVYKAIYNLLLSASTSSWKRMKKKVRIAAADKHLSGKELQAKVNSHLGVMSHYDCYDMRRVFFGYESGLTEKGRFDKDILRFYPS